MGLRIRVSPLKWLGCLLVSGLLALTASPGVAVGDGNAEVVSPFYWQNVTVGWTGPVTLDLSNAAIGTYRVEVVAADYRRVSYAEVRDIVYDGSQDTYTVDNFEPIAVSGSYYVRLSRYTGWSQVEVAFTALPAMQVDDRTVSPTTFYPVVRDEYLDTTELTYQLNQPASVVAVVLNSAGEPVRRAELGSQAPGIHGWSWDGTRDDGATVADGDFTVTLSATSDAGDEDSLQRTVTVAAGPAVDVLGERVSYETFYPVVRDEYRDTTTMRYELNIPASVTAVVRDSRGSTVRRVVIGEQSPGTHSWPWDGTKDDGTTVDSGEFTITVTGTNEVGSTDSAAASARVATRIVTRQATRTRWGSLGRDSTRGNCRVTRELTEGTATLDCRGGRYARMRYGFKIPTEARNLRWRVRGAVAHLDICCDGHITKWGTRSRATRYVLGVEVTGWRAYDVSAARVTYDVRTRI